jgi:predicted nucleic acid-binding protein
MVILDTSIIIDHLRLPITRSKLAHIVKKHPQEEFAISLLTIQELYQGQSTRKQTQEADLVTVLASLKVLPYTYDIAKLAGTLARDLSQPIELADAAIAATALAHHCPLYTLNTKDFDTIPNLVLI